MLIISDNFLFQLHLRTCTNFTRDVGSFLTLFALI